MTVIETVKTRMRQRLVTLDKSESKAAFEAGLSRSAIRDILSGKSGNPGVETLVAICGPLECTLAYLIGHDATPKPRLDAINNLISEAADSGFRAHEQLIADLDAIQCRIDKIRTRIRSTGMQAVSLRHWLRENGMTQAEFAEAVGIHWVHLSKFINGHRRPGVKIIERIEKATSGAVTFDSWRENNEQEQA